MSKEETLCPQCGKVTRTILGGCPNCGGPKENPVYFPPRRASGGFLFDGDFPLGVFAGSTVLTTVVGTAIALIVGWEFGLIAAGVLAIGLYAVGNYSSF